MMTTKLMNRDFIANNSNLNFRNWWIKINTIFPRCTYYFGPFYTLNEALEHQNGYLEDLIEEGASGIAIEIEKCQPQNLTVEIEN